MPKTTESPISVETPEIPEPVHSNKKRILLLVALVGILVGISIFLLPTQQAVSPQDTDNKTLISKITPTPMPFADLTVPFLRNREYKSSLGELELISENANYNSYLTNYESDGFRINGLLTVPKGDPSASPQDDSRKYPAIVFIHGYIPPASYTTTGQYGDYVDYLARNGFVVFKIDLRGHGNSEGEAGGGYYGSDYVIDTLHAHSALALSGFVNPNKIGLWGHSMAGNVVMRSMAVKPELPAAAIWAGAVYTYEDQRKYGINDSSFSPTQLNSQRQKRRRELFEKYGSPSAQSAFWKQVAPTNFLQDLKGAIEIHHAVNDTVVDIGYSRDLMALLDKTSVPHTLYEYSSGGHNIQDTSFDSAMQRTVAFFEKYLK